MFIEQVTHGLKQPMSLPDYLKISSSSFCLTFFLNACVFCTSFTFVGSLFHSVAAAKETLTTIVLKFTEFQVSCPGSGVVRTHDLLI